MFLPKLEQDLEARIERGQNTNLCLSLMLEPGWSADDILRRAADAGSLELRLDKVPGADITEISERFDGDIIASIRRVRDGGDWRGREKDRLKELLRLANSAIYVDVEFDLFDDFMQSKSLPEDFSVICSWHVHKKEWATFIEDFDNFLECGPDVHKLVLPEGVPLSQIFSIQNMVMHHDNVNLSVVHGLGTNATCSRILGITTFNLWTYVAETAATLTAGGQLTLAEARDVYGLHKRDFAARRCGIIGYPLAHSKSVQLHNRLATELGLNMVYVACEVPEAEEVAQLLPQLDAWSVTLPYKRLAAQYANIGNAPEDEIQICNTLWNHNGPLSYGANTDQSAIRIILHDHVADIASALVYGSGATARTAILTLQDLGIKNIAVAARNLAAAERLAEDLQVHLAQSSASYDLVMQCSAAGMWPKDQELSPAAGYLPAAKIAFDVVYNPAETAFLKRAAELGIATCITGERMFILQAQHQFKLLTGHLPELELMYNIWEELQI